MKKVYIVLVVLMFVFFTFTTTYFIILIHGSGIDPVQSSTLLIKSVNNYDYHFVVIAQSTDDPFWESVKKGAFNAAKELNAAVEFNGPRFTNIDEELQYLDIAIASRVDGIATHILDEKRFTPLVNKAVSKNIPVVTIEADAKNSKRQSFISTNSFKSGFEAGKLIAEATKGKAKVAIIFDTINEDEENIMQNIKLQGFQQALKSYPEVKISTIKNSKMGIFSAEEVTQNILNNFPEVNAFYCTGSKDTIGTAQIVVDFNRVKDFTIVGYGNLPEILRYIENGVIYGTIVSDPVSIGYESIKALVEINKGNRVSSYISTGVHTVTRKNIENYKTTIQTKDRQDVGE